ncbi:MAG: flavodoxin family protein, partial [Desulfamplus sp.]|nr:flavodoxin family protein [Desulfamplus sp.]
RSPKSQQALIHNLQQHKADPFLSYCDKLPLQSTLFQHRFHQEILTADAVILGSPVYMWQFSAQTKLFVDRLFAMLNPDYSVKFKSGLPLVLVYTQGQPDVKAFAGYFDMNAKMFEFLKFKVIDTLVCGGCRNKEDVEKNEAIIAKAKEMGEYLTTLK